VGEVIVSERDGVLRLTSRRAAVREASPDGEHRPYHFQDCEDCVKQITTYPNTDSLALPTPPLAHGPDHAQARALALQVVPPTAYHAQFSVEQRAAYNLAQAYLALAPQPSAPPQERVSEELREAAKFAIQVLDEQATISRTMEHLNGSITEHARAVGLEAMHKPAHGVSLALRRLTAALTHGQTMSNEIREYDTNGNVINTRTNREYDINGKR
jgi:hypothetical protein